MMEIVSAASMGRLKTDEIEYQGFKSKITPDHGVRYVNPQLCDPNVTQVEVVLFDKSWRIEDIHFLLLSTRVISIWGQRINSFSGFSKANMNQKQNLWQFG